MVKYNGSVTVPFARARVSKLLSDWTNLAAWDMNITRSERIAGQPGEDGVGTRFSCTFELNGRASEVDYRCVALDRGALARFAGTTSLGPGVGVRTQDTLAFRDAPDGGTIVDAEFDLRFRGLLTPLSFLMNGTMQETGPVVMKDIDAFVKKELGSDAD